MTTLPDVCWKLTAGSGCDNSVRFNSKFTSLHYNNSDLGFQLAGNLASVGIRGSDGLGRIPVPACISNFLDLLPLFRKIDALWPA